MKNNTTTAADQTNFNLNSVDDGLVVIFGNSGGGQLLANELTRFLQSKKVLEQLGCNVVFVSDRETGQNTEEVLVDSQNSYHHLSPSLDRIGESVDSIIFLIKENGSTKHIYTKLRPETKHNWIDQVIGFSRNYNNTESEAGLFKFGQKVPESGEYLCTDCGYIIELNQGDIFPVCDVCLSGDPRGACNINTPFWKKLDD